MLDKSAAEDKDAVVVTRETATQLQRSGRWTTLAAHAAELVFGGPPEFQTRPDGIPGIAETYGCTFKEFSSLDAGGPLTVAALKNGDVQAADLFTTRPDHRGRTTSSCWRTRRTTSPRRTSCR